MKEFSKFICLPSVRFNLAASLLLGVMKSFTALVRPLAKLLPKWLPAEHILAFLFVLIICCLIGLMVRTPTGRATWKRMENSLLQGSPGYALFRSLTQHLTGKTQDQAWKPALAEIEEALVPAFIIEEHEYWCFTVFVPSVLTPLAGAIYILSPDRVNSLGVPFTRAIKVVSHWGSGSKDLVAVVDRKKPLSSRGACDDVRIGT